MKRIFIVCLILIQIQAFGQFTDDFTDGDFTNNPAWSGDNSLFTVTSGELNSQSAGAAIYYLSTSSTLATETEWSFFINPKFSTSGANFVDVYLVSDSADLTAAMNGYFVRIGNTADEISLYKIVAGAESIIIDGTDGTINSSSNNPFNIRVSRDATDLWLLEIDDGATGSYTTEGVATDSSISNSTHFGVKINQSSAASPVNNHFFDNFSIEVIVPDTTPPSISDVQAISSTEIDVEFDEAVAQALAETLTNYSIDGGIGQPSLATLDASNISLVHLTFSNPFINNTAYEITIQNVEDLSGNEITTEVKMFTVLIPEIAEADDIIINEIFADPTPSRQLPEAEFVEIHNRSNKYIDLANYTLSDEVLTTSQRIIAPGEYVTLCDEDDLSLFEPYGEVIGLESWNTLTNGGETITLIDAGNMQVIDQVIYNDNWYNSLDKSEGGWSLELIDPENTCGEESNWTASIDDDGGTPGSANSVLASKPDLTGPKLLSAFGISQDSLTLSFDERLDTTTFASTVYSFTPSLSIDHAVLSDGDREVIIVLASDLQPATDYQITVTQLRDCNGNLIDPANISVFGLPEVAELGDLLINELLYNPITSNGDFVEIYNHSTKYINLKEWTIANGNNQDPDNLKTITGDNLIIAPMQYLVFTEEPLAVGSDYPKGIMENFVEVSALPSFPNDGQGVLLIDPSDVVFDYFPYDDDIQHPLLDDTKGVSLERISFDSPTSDPNNWHSAAKDVGFATPGYLNSQALGSQVRIRNQVTISPEVFLPNQSGQDDFTTINYAFDQPGFVANVSVIDISGRVIKQLTQNKLLAVEGFLQWDGTMDDGRKARSGVYIVHFEVFDLSGNQQIIQKRVVVAPQL